MGDLLLFKCERQAKIKDYTHFRFLKTKVIPLENLVLHIVFAT